MQQLTEVNFILFLMVADLCILMHGSSLAGRLLSKRLLKEMTVTIG
jgi:hypothetical protein